MKKSENKFLGKVSSPDNAVNSKKIRQILLA
jgi:hypothetical protein